MSAPHRQAVVVAPDALHDAASSLFDSGHRLALVAGHDEGARLRVVYAFVAEPTDHRVELHLELDAAVPSIPTISDLSFSASRFERELHDSFGIVPVGHPFLRPLLRHQHWPASWHPMRLGAEQAPPMAADAASYPFVEVEGGGVYEIPVGPVHAGLIEPGHFRFSVVGETVLKMTARLWFVHRGIERMFQGVAPVDGVPIAERISGDTAVGHALAYCLAVEEASGIEVSSEDQLARVALLELERLYNHVGDLGAMCSDVSFGVAHARALVLRERLLRLNEQVTGHRLLRGGIAPGATAIRRLPDVSEIDGIAGELDALVELTRASSVVVDRFEGTAVLSHHDAVAIGTLGVVARASGIDADARRGSSFAPPVRSFRLVRQTGGDVLARFNQRVEELAVSFEMLREVSAMLRGRAGPAVPPAFGAGDGLGIVEGARGAIVHRVEVDDNGVVARCRVVDPSFHNWPALSVSLADTIVPDFPLANKSFNLSYAGNDL